jgi:hypothetical protein
VRKATAPALRRGEAMLTAQAHALDALLTQLAERAALDFGQHMEAPIRYMRVAVKTQTQCRGDCLFLNGIVALRLHNSYKVFMLFELSLSDIGTYWARKKAHDNSGVGRCRMRRS